MWYYYIVYSCSRSEDDNFATTIGTQYIPIAKILIFPVLLPAVFFDAYLVDRFHRYQLVVLYTVFFGLLGVILSFLVAHPEIGLDNPIKGPDRIIGWLFWTYLECFNPFVVGVLWAFINSIHNPSDSRKTYAFITSFSKFGGMVAALFGYAFISQYGPFNFEMSSTQRIQIIVLIAGVIFILVGVLMSLSVKIFSNEIFKGYHTNVEEKTEKTGIFIGLKILAKNRYVFCIFLLLFFTDILVEIVNYKRMQIVFDSAGPKKAVSESLAILYYQIFGMQATGFICSLFFTNTMMRLLSIPICLFAMPLISLTLLSTYIVTGVEQFVIWVYIILKATHYTIGLPVRESLYIITSKDIQFKAKFAIDALGIKLGKNAGHILNLLTTKIGSAYGAIFGNMATNIIFVTVPGLWLFVASYLGRRYNKSIQDDKLVE